MIFYKKIRRTKMKTIITSIIFLSIFFTRANTVLAVCPVCTVAVAGGVGLSRWLGIDDTISGLWIGGLIASMGLWLADLLKKKYTSFLLKPLAILLVFLLVVPALYLGKMIGLPANTLWGIDKLILGILSGMGFFAIGNQLDLWLRKTNNGKVYIYYQKVILPVLLLSLMSVIFYLLIV